MKSIRQIQRDILLDEIQQELVSRGISLHSQEAKAEIQLRLLRACGKPVFRPSVVSGPIDVGGINNMLMDITADINIVLQATEELDRAISLTAILTDVEHKTNQLRLNDAMSTTAYLKAGGLVFADSFDSSNKVDLSHSTAIVDTAIGAVKHKSSLAKQAIQVPTDQSIMLEPGSAYTAISVITPPQDLLLGTGPFTTVYQTNSPAGFSVLTTIAVPMSNKTYTLTLSSVIGYMEVDYTFSGSYADTKWLQTRLGPVPTPIQVPAGVGLIRLRLTKTMPDLDEQGANYYIFSLDQLKAWNINEFGTSYVITNPIRFADLNGADISLHNVAITAKTQGGGSVTPFVSICTDNQPPETLNWVEAPLSSVVKISSSFQGIISPDSITVLNTNQIQIAEFDSKLSSTRVTAGMGVMQRTTYGVSNSYIEKAATGVATQELISGGKRIYIPIDAFNLQSDESIATTGAISYIKVGRTVYPTTIPYTIVGVAGNQFMRITLPALPPNRRWRRIVVDPVFYEDDATSYAIKIRATKFVVDNSIGSWVGQCILKSGESISITSNATSCVLQNLETGAVLSIKPGTTRIDYQQGWRTFTVLVTGNDQLNRLVSFDDPNKILAFGTLTQVVSAPAPGEYMDNDGKIIVGNPCNLKLTDVRTGNDFNIASLEQNSSLFFKVEYLYQDVDTKTVRLKFELDPGVDTVSLLEYAASFQPSTVALEPIYDDFVEKFDLSTIQPIGASNGTLGLVTVGRKQGNKNIVTKVELK
jgi:hypothetical protein